MILYEDNRLKTRPYFKKFLRVFLTSLVYILFFLVWYFVLEILLGIRHPAPALFITLMITIYFHEQTTYIIRDFIDKTFYRRIHAVNRSLNNFNVELNSTLDYQTLIRKFIQFLKTTFPENSWAFYLRWGEDYELFEQNRIEEKISKLFKLPTNAILDKILKEEIDFHSLSRLRQKSGNFKKIFRDLPETNDFYYFYPLKSYKGYVGFLLLGRNFNYYLHFWELKKMIMRILNKTADVLENSQLYSEVNRKSLQNHLLLEIGKKISAILHLNDVLETIIDSVHQLVSSDAAGIFLIDEQNNVLRRMVTRGYNTDLLDKLSLKLDLGSYGWVIRNKKPSIINDVSADAYYYPVRRATRSQLTVPLLNGEEVKGVMALESNRINHFTPADLELLMTFASQAVIAIENAQLYEESLQKKRLESELIVASKVQKALLPDRPPHFKGLKIGTVNIPSLIVGGDFFDIFRFSETRLAVAIGDVSGKGAPASILMAMLYAGFKSLLKEIYPVVEIVARLNNLFTETTAEGYFATFVFGIIDKSRNEFTYTNAGHNAPILLRRDHSVERLTIGGIVLGFLGNQEYRQETVRLQSGDYLVFFTDGVTEIKNSQGQEFGDDRLIKFILDNYGKKPSEIQTLLLKEIRKFSAQRELSDDVTLIIINVE